MKNNFINNNGAILPNTKKNPKTKVESQIETLKTQEQEIITELNSWQTKQKKANDYLTSLSEVERFSTRFLAEAVESEKSQTNPNGGWLEHLITNKLKFAFKFETGVWAFNQLVFQKIESQVNVLKSQLKDYQSQIQHQERIFMRIEVRRQGRVLLECKLKSSLGCLGVYQCASCQTNYAINKQQFQEVATP